MRLLIIENDDNAIERLEKLLVMAAPEKKVVGVCRTLQEAKQWLNDNLPPDLVLSEAQLPDGLCFDLFHQLDRKIHVIFISAYDKYAIAAFKTRGLHFLLKPVSKEDLKEALERHDQAHLVGYEMKHPQPSTKYQERFIIKTGAQIRLLYDSEIAYIYTENKAVYVVSFNNQKFLVPISIEAFEKSLNPRLFYRINRQVIINLNAIRKMKSTSKQRIQITLEPSTSQETVTSFERTPDFKKWLTGGM
ncbi:MAG: response regulator transcription factor [Bacteroidetes bacterium]|nr:response regulator transcription factor [Bacteroidota bacterium]